MRRARALGAGIAGAGVLVLALASMMPSGATTSTTTTSSGVVTHGGITTTKDTVGWLLDCAMSHSLADDPILFPGQPGAAHLHDFTGNASTNAASTVASMEAGANNSPAASYNGSATTAGTSCDLPTYAPGTAGDTAAYWRPALYANGAKVTPTVKDELYYRAKPLLNAGQTFEAIPQDARLIVGSSGATSYAGNAAIQAGHIYWEDSSGAKVTELPQSGSSFLMNVIFPSCWDGLPMDHAFGGTDNGHFAYAAGSSCPAGFSHAVAQLSEKFKYSNVPAGVRELASMQDPATMRAGGWTAHADFWNTWNPTALQYLTDRCLNAHVSCGTNPITPLTP
jgi:hypothetical protein